MKAVNRFEVEGKHFVIFGDNISTGNTATALRDFIEENGGAVLGYASLTKGRDSTDNMAITLEQYSDLKNNMERILSMYRESSKDLQKDGRRPYKKNPHSFGMRLTEEELKELHDLKAEVDREYEKRGRQSALARREELIREGILKPKKGEL